MSTRIRAAASSTASGRQSTFRQISRISDWFASVGSKSGCRALARWSKSSIGGSRVQRRDGKDVLTRDVEDGAARHEQREAGRARDELRVPRGGLPHVLGVVQHEQQLPTAKRVREGVDRRFPGDLREAECLRDRRGDELGVP